MNESIVVPFDGHKAHDIQSGGVTITIGFERLRSIICNTASVAIADNETISGFLIDDRGVTCRIVKK